MTEEEKIYLYELNETYTDGFVRGYNRGFLDGIAMAAQVRVELTEQLKREEKFNDQKTKVGNGDSRNYNPGVNSRLSKRIG